MSPPAGAPSSGLRPAFVQTLWARSLLAALAESGIRDAVVSPGSRSTPFVQAAARSALRLHVVVDERAAGFVALGMARATGRPTLLICTSGTAGAHYYPAVIEASAAHVPVVVLTADRPPELQGCGAPQTIEQTQLFGVHARAFVDLGPPDASLRSFQGLRRRVLEAAATSIGPQPGAVHLNAPARKPLEQTEAAGAEEHELARQVGESNRRAPPRLASAPAAPPRSEVDVLLKIAARTERGVIVAGPLGPGGAALRRTAAAVSARTGWPLLVESPSQLRVAGLPAVGSFGLLFQDAEWAALHGPEFVLQLGPAPTSSAWYRRLDGDEPPRRVVVAEHGPADPWRSAERVIRASPGLLLEALAEGLDGKLDRGLDGSWARSLLRADARMRAVLDADHAATFSERAATAALVRSLPSDALLCVGNSLSIRVLDQCGVDLPPGVRVLAQRGANGIDGGIAGAIGAAVATGRPTAMLLGDVALRHDLASLGLGMTRGLESAGIPLLVAVLDNGGGRIFERLPIADGADLDGAELDPWTTPWPVDVEAVAGALGCGFAGASEGDAWADALRIGWQVSGIQVLRAQIAPHAALAADRRVLTDFRASSAALPAVTEQVLR